MTGEEIWEGRAFQLLLDQRRTLQKAIRTFDVRIATLDELSSALLRDRDRIILDLQDLEEELDGLEAWEGDPAVLVRRSVGGYGPRPYHDAVEPCGHASQREQFDEMLLGEAEEALYPPCGFCGHLASERRRYTAAA